MKISAKIFTVLLLSIGSLGLAQKGPKSVDGTWDGTIKTPDGDLGIVLNMNTEQSALKVKLDVPAQHAKGLLASASWYRNDTLFLEFEKLFARFIGLASGDESIAGTWEQGSSEFPLKLGKRREMPGAHGGRQEPSKPYPYHEEEVLIQNKKAGVKLAGTFTWPANQLNCPAVILVTGSGPQNRDEELLGHKPFLVLADHLTRKGIAVLRFDDRGTGESTGDFSNASSLDFASDVEAVLEYIKKRGEINKNKIGILGHSEGGMIAPIVAGKHPSEVGFIVSLAGPGLNCLDALLLQAAAISKAAGMNESEIEKSRKINQRVYQLARTGTKADKDSIRSILIRTGFNEDQSEAQIKMVFSPWFRYFLSYDPAPVLVRVKCPVLALNGKMDVQVPYNENLSGIEAGLKKGGNIHCKTIAYEGLNHLFQHCNTGLPAEYASIEETMSPDVLEDISLWILSLK